MEVVVVTWLEVTFVTNEFRIALPTDIHPAGIMPAKDVLFDQTNIIADANIHMLSEEEAKGGTKR